MDRNILFIAAMIFAGCSAAPRPEVRVAGTSTPCRGGVVSGDRELERYVGCRTVVGELDVRGVTSLAPLGSLERVEGTLRIERTDKLYSLAGLERLRSVDVLDIRENTGLISGGALHGLGHVRRAHLSNNPRLSKTYGLLDAIEKTGGVVYLSNNSGLTAEGVVESEDVSGALAER